MATPHGSAAKPSFGADLRRLRQAAGLTQEQLAGRAGLTVKAIRAMERGEHGRLNRDTVNALAAALSANTSSVPPWPKL